MNRGESDVELPVTFLCSRAKDPTLQDMSKLERLISFLKGSINNVRKIGIKNRNSHQHGGCKLCNASQHAEPYRWAHIV